MMFTPKNEKVESAIFRMGRQEGEKEQAEKTRSGEFNDMQCCNKKYIRSPQNFVVRHR